MQAHVEAMVKSLVAVAWADGRLEDAERQVLEALIATFELAHDDAAALRDYAAQPRTLDDVPLVELSAEDRRLLLQHAVVVTYVDGELSPRETALLGALAERLRIPAPEAEQLLSAAQARAERLKSLL